MTSYINGVQQVSITIPNGATSATATVTAATGTAFLIYQGATATQAGTNSAISAPRVTLTNPTTLTATRNTSDTSTVTVNVIVVDATSSLVKSVQFGTIAVGASSTGTASITAVTIANTAIAYLGYTTTTTSSSPISEWPALSLTSTVQVTATVGSSGSSNTVGFCVIEFQGAALNQSVQAVSDTASPAAATRTHAITSVDVNNTMLIWGGQLTSGGAGYTSGFQYATLTNGTTITIGTQTAGFVSIRDNIFVVEFVSGVLSQNAQRGTIPLTAATSGTASITSADTTLTIANFVGNSSTGATFGTDLGKITQTNTTTVTGTVNTAATAKLSWEALTFTTASAAATIEYITTPEEDEVFLNQWDEDEPTQMNITAAGSPSNLVEVYSAPEEDGIYDYGNFYGIEEDELPSHVFPDAGNPVGTEGIFGSPPEEDDIRLDQWDEDETTQPIFQKTVEWLVSPEEDEVYLYPYPPDDDEFPSPVFPAAGNPTGTEALLSSPEEDDIRLDQWDEDEPSPYPADAAAVVTGVEWLPSVEEDEVRLDQWDEDDLFAQIVFPFSVVDAIQQASEEEEVRLDAAEEDEPGQQPVLQFTVVNAIQNVPEEDEVRLDAAEEDEPAAQPIFAFSTVHAIQASEEDFFEDIIIIEDENTFLVLSAVAVISGVEWLTSVEDAEVFDYLAEEDEPSFPAFIGASVANTMIYFSPDDLFNYISV